MNKPKRATLTDTGVAPLAVHQRKAATMLGISVKVLRKIPRELLGHYTQGRTEMYAVKDLEAYIEQRKTEAAQE